MRHPDLILGIRIRIRVLGVLNLGMRRKKTRVAANGAAAA